MSFHIVLIQYNVSFCTSTNASVKQPTFSRHPNLKLDVFFHTKMIVQQQYYVLVHRSNWMDRKRK